MNTPSKQKTHQNLIAKAGKLLMDTMMPKTWEMRKYSPDYGLDFAVEVFEGEDKSSPQTLGEHFFIQLKSTQSPTTGPFYLHKSGNDEMGREQQASRPSMSLNTYRIKLDTKLLVTVEKMGVGQPVLLVVADITRNRCSFVCLNDYVDKILIPKFEDKEYSDAKHRTVHVPYDNDLSTPKGRTALRWYAKRSKMISAFQRFTFQHSQLCQAECGDWRPQAINFAREIARYDFWDDLEMCSEFGIYRKGLRRFIDEGQPRLMERSIPLIDDKALEGELDDFLMRDDVFQLWRGLSTLPKLYENIWREWFLPTELGIMTGTVS